MELQKICIALLALMLAAMVMVPLVSASENSSQDSDQDNVNIRELFKPIDETVRNEISRNNLESDPAKSEKIFHLSSDIVKKYDSNLDGIVEHLDKKTNGHLDDAKKSTLKEIIVSEHIKRISDKMLMENRGLIDEDAIVIKPKVLGFVDNNNLSAIERESAKSGTFILAQSAPDIYGGVGFDVSGQFYSVLGNNQLYEVRVWPGNPTSYQFRYYDEDHPDLETDAAYDALRLAVYGNLLDYSLIDVTDSQIYLRGCWNSGQTFAFPTGIHGNKYRPMSSIIYVANIWNHDIDTTNSNTNMGQIVMSVPYIQQ